MRMDNFTAILNTVERGDFEYAETVKSNALRNTLDLTADETEQVLAACRRRMRELRGQAIGRARNIGLLAVALMLSSVGLTETSAAESPRSVAASGHTFPAPSQRRTSTGLLPDVTSKNADRGAGINIERLADAIYLAEGGSKTRHPYGILTTYKHTTPRQACINTIRHSLKDWDGKGEFIAFLGSRYCPTKGKLTLAERRLNGNWIDNVTKLYNAKDKP